MDIDKSKAELLNHYIVSSSFDIRRHTKDKALIDFYNDAIPVKKRFIEMYFELMQDMHNEMTDEISFEHSRGDEYTFGIRVSLREKKISLSQGVENK